MKKIILFIFMFILLVHGMTKCCYSRDEHPQYEKLARLLAREKYEEAERYCSRLKGKKQKECCRILGDVFFDKADYNKAIFYYEKGTRSSWRANAYAAMADDYRTGKNNGELAKKYYTKAVDEYEYFIKDYHYMWNLKDSEQRRKCIDTRDLLPKSPGESAQQLRLHGYWKKQQIIVTDSRKISLFFSARKLSRNTLIYHGTM